jgi:TolA-binding protein
VLEVSERTAQTECRLVVGEVLVHVPEGSTDGFAVVTATTRVDVTGTVFGVSAHATGATSVTVWNGRVRVSGGEARESLEAGQHWPLGAQRLRATDADMDLLAAGDRVDIVEPEPARALEPPQARSSRASSRAVPSAPTRARSDAAPAERDLYARARDVEASGDRREAARLYERAAGEAGATAEAAAFAAARLYSGLAEHALARRVLSSYRAQHPNGLYARAADVLWLRALVAEGDSVGVERESERFLRNYPDDPRAGQFRAARALDRARRGRCVEARADLREVEQAVLDRLEETCPLQR